ncbi:SsrA-binding protein SmpB [Patescibacteria group bacterium]|nr:SsrA-binding protein SmpB [Patescibacteria group bacterium]
MSNYATNKKVHFDYELLDTFEAGLVLLGTEVKAVRAGRAKLDGGHVVVRGGQALVVGISIPAFQIPNAPKSYDPERPRILLLKQKELATLERETETVGLTAIPLALYNSGRNIKLKIAIARGKKKADKRESLKARDSKREIERTLKSQY